MYWVQESFWPDVFLYTFFSVFTLFYFWKKYTFFSVLHFFSGKYTFFLRIQEKPDANFHGNQNRGGETVTNALGSRAPKIKLLRWIYKFGISEKVMVIFSSFKDFA